MSVQIAAEILREKGMQQPDVGIILGTGLGGSIAESIEDVRKVSYKDIADMPVPEVEGHAGDLLWGRLEGKRVMVFHGRVHCYEGYSAQQVAYSVRLLQALDVPSVIVTNIAGGLNLDYGEGDFMLIDDHINLMGVNPLVGPNDNRLGPRFPDMSAPYHPQWQKQLQTWAGEQSIRLNRGVYVGVMGPNLETRAEYRFLRQAGADAVGMSTLPEVITAVHSGMNVMGLSLITDVCDPDNLKPADIPHMLKVAADAEPKFKLLLQGGVRYCPEPAGFCA